MILTPGLRKLALTAHVTSSVGWLGAVVVFLALAILGLTSRDAQTVRGAYLVMEPAAWFVLLPLAFASLLTGIVQSLGTAWGLFRHYWVLFKLLITVFATVVLLFYMETFRVMADVAADPSADLSVVRNPSPALHALFALIVLLTATLLAVYKPGATTPFGRRRKHEEGRMSRPIPPRPLTPTRSRGDTYIAGLPARPDSDGDSVVRSIGGPTPSTARWVKVSGIVVIHLVLLFIVLHLTGGGTGRH